MNEAENSEAAVYFRRMALPTLIYSILFPLFVYDNTRGITLPCFVIATLLYAFYGMQAVGVRRKPATKWYATAMILLAVSDVLTANADIVAMNNLGIFLMLICMLLHNYCDDSSWSLGDYLLSIAQACFGTVESLGAPFHDGDCYKKEGKSQQQRTSQGIYVLIGIIIAIPLLIIITVLLSSADAVFANMINQIHLDWNFGTWISVAVMFFAALFASYCGLRYLGKGRIPSQRNSGRTREPVIAITVLFLISIVYLLFSGIQIMYLFLGKMQLPSGYNYAEYAREGFFQLLFVCMMNLVLVLLVQGMFRQHKLLKLLLTVISVCTYIMLASSGLRMLMYIKNYNLTFQRILVLWALAILAILLIGIMIQVYREKFPLFQYCLIVVTIGYLLLSYSHPDYLIAKYNLKYMTAQTQATENAHDGAVPGSDYNYLTQLSCDAAPAIAQESGEWVEEYVRHLAGETRDGVHRWNASEANARHLFGDQMKSVQETIDIQVNNDTQDTAWDIGLTYSINGSTVGTVASGGANGNSIDYPSLIAQKIDTAEGTFACALEKRDFTGNKENAVTTLDKIWVQQVELYVTFIDADGTTQTSNPTTIDLEFGQSYTFALTGDKEMGYDLYLQ